MLKPKLHVEDEIAKITKHSRLESPLAYLARLIVMRQGGNRPDCFPVIFCDKCIMSQESVTIILFKQPLTFKVARMGICRMLFCGVCA